ncbi:MAG: XrtA/PEP-CTERM system TPR-repeat protein PrsT [Burkholderiaceae bacterium]
MKRIGTLGRWAPICGMVLLLAACSGDSAQSLLEEARKQIDAKDSKAAVIQLKNALQKEPKLAEARFLLGKLLLDGGDAVGAAIELQKAQELGYAPDPLLPLLAKAMLGSGEAQKVIDRFGGQTLSTASAQAELQLVLANAYRATGKPDKAQIALDAALKAEPGQVGAQLLRVRMLAAEKDVSAAGEALNKVIATAPASSEARQLRGELLLAGGDRDAALAAFKEAIERDKLNVAAHAALLQLLLGNKDVAGAEAELQVLRELAPRNPQVKFFTAVMALDKGDLKLADEQAQALLKQMPDYVPALQLSGTVALRQGAFVQAEADFTKALTAAPGNARLRLLLAQTSLRLGDSAKAIRLLQTLADASPPQWEPNALMAQALLMSGDAAKAETFFARAAKLNPKDTRSRTALAMAHVANGKTEQQGFDELRTISDGDTGPIADLAMISALTRKKDLDGALRAIAQLEKKQAGQPLAPYLRGQTELQRGARAQARAAFEDALKRAPGYVPAAMSIAAMDIADGKPELARQRFEKMVADDPKDVKSSMALLRLRMQDGAPKEQLLQLLRQTIQASPGDPAPRLALATLLMEQKDFKAAAAAAQEGLSAVPDNLELLDLLGQAQFLGGDVNQATTTYNKMASLSSNSPLPATRLAEMSVAQKDPAAATQYFKKALALKPDHLPALRGLMTLEVAAGRPASALAIARTVQAQSGTQASGFVLEGDLQSGQKEWAEAARAYRSGLERQALPEIAIKLHRVLLAGGRADEALKLEQQWLKQHPKDAVFVYHLADTALAKSDFMLAQQYYETVLRLVPDQPLALNNLAWLLNRARKPDALTYALRANKLAPKEPAFMDTLAEIYASNEQLPKAIEIQQAAVAAGPDIAVHRLHLARYYLVADDKARAKAELTRLAALGDKFSEQAEVKAMLAKL